MPSILNLKFKGNKSFVPFSNLGDADSLTMTWKVCTKVASFLEQGQRLENLSWRLWHLQNLMVDTDNAKSKREFKKLSKCMGDKLDKEKGRSIEELQAPGFRRNHSTDLIQQRAVEREKEREANNSGRPGIHRMQFTFSIEAPTELTGPAAHPIPTQKPDLKPSAEFKDNAGRRGRPSARAHAASAVASTSGNDASSSMAASASATAPLEVEQDKPLTQRGRRPISTTFTTMNIESDAYGGAALRFPSLFSNDFGPAALLYPTPTLTNVMTYGEGLNASISSQATAANDFSVSRPTIELGLDELLNADSPSGWVDHDVDMKHELDHEPVSEEDLEQEHDDSGYSTSSGPEQPMQHAQQRVHAHGHSRMEDDAPRGMRRASLLGQAEDVVPRTITPSRLGPSLANSSIPVTATAGPKRPTLSVRTARAGPSATPVGNGTSIQAQHPSGNNNSAPGGVKAECSNCGATHTPLWRRGLNDELNCNACGLYCKLHKRPRPKSMRNNHGEGRAQTAPRQESQEVVAQCYNCHTTATPLWRKDDEGKTVCNACGLYYKLHGSPRPISMKSDVIRKRARHDARRGGGAVSETPSASPGASRRASPIDDGITQGQPGDPQVQGQSQGSNGYDEQDYSQGQSQELMNALGSQADYAQYFQLSTSFPGPYHPDYIPQLAGTPADTLAYPGEEYDSGDSLGRVAKRRRLSNDSASEPPSSATSYSSYADSFASGSPAPSSQSSLEYPFSYGTYGLFSNRAVQSYYHPPMLPPNVSENYVHPPMLPPGTEDGGGAMDFLHGSGMHHDEADALFATYLHPPMVPPEDSPKVAMGALQPHPPMAPQEWGAAYEYHEAAMQAY